MSEVLTIGAATLYHGDCLDVLPTLADESVDMIWTDPPYGHNNADGDFLAARHEIMKGGGKTAAVAIAHDDADGMRAVVDAMLDQGARLLKADCCCCCGGGGPRPTFAWLAQRMDTRGLTFFHSVIWDKLNPGIGWRYRRQHEMVMVAHRRGGKLAWSGELDAISNIHREAKPVGNEHPNLKPLGLIRRFIAAHTKPGDTILDPFMGSGSTGAAAVAMNRRFIGIELERGYFETACRRIEDAQRMSDMFIASPNDPRDAYERHDQLSMALENPQ